MYSIVFIKGSIKQQLQQQQQQIQIQQQQLQQYHK